MGQQQLLLIILGVIIVGIAVAVGITMFKTNAVSANRDALVGDMTNIAARAQQHYRRPISLGGGGGDFTKGGAKGTGFELAPKEAKNPNGSYVVTSISAGQIVLTGTGTEIGDNNTSPVVMVMTVAPDSITSTAQTN
ncbi:MAG: hypothetical protein ABSB78_09280 [Bacteroidota bacterium]